MSGVTAEWLGHPGTVAYRKKLEEKIRAEYAMLMGACRKSTDGDVRGAYGRLTRLEELRDEMEPKNGT